MVKRNIWLGKVPILVFHDVSPKWNPFTEPLTPETFEKIIKQLKKYYRIRPVEDLLKIKPNELKGSCFITFDDGLKNFKDFAYPILKKNDIKTAMFLPTYCITENVTIWNYVLADLIDGLDIPQLKINVNGTLTHYSTESPADKIEAFNRLNDNLKKFDFETISDVIKQISLVSGAKTNSFALMNWSEVKKIQDEGFVKFYSHSHKHLFLPNQSDDILLYELSESNNIISKETQSNKKLLAYPVGGYNNTVLKYASQHYDMAFAVDDEMLKLKKLNSRRYNYKIPRFNIADQSPSELLLRINGFHKFIKKYKLS